MSDSSIGRDFFSLGEDDLSIAHISAEKMSTLSKKTFLTFHLVSGHKSFNYQEEL